MKIDTKCMHSGYAPENGQAHILPIYQSTTFDYASTEHIGKLFDLSEDGFFYSRIANPTVDAVEKKLADMEGGVGAMCTTSGQAASTIAVLNIAGAGSHILASSSIYGGTTNLLGVTLKKFGVDVTFFDPDADTDSVERLIRPNTKAVFGETIANPALSVFDIERFADMAHRNKLPLIIDNTFATPYLCRPIEFGADIVIHSTTKYLDGHAAVMGGVIIDSGKFTWPAEKFPELNEPDDSYHGVIYKESFGTAAYIAKARLQLMRDIGAYPPAFSAFLLNLGIETLAVRMDRHCSNALAVAEFLSAEPHVASVSYPVLPGDKYNALCKKYLPSGAGGVISFELSGGRSAAVKFMDSLKLAVNCVHVADLRTLVLHPASSTHRQLTDEQICAAGITPGTIRLSVGIENIQDILSDLKAGFAAL